MREGKGASPQKGSLVVLDWSGYTSGYQAKRIDNTQNTDNQFVFRLGSGEAIPAFEEAVEGMRVGGVRRIEIPGELEERLGLQRGGQGSWGGDPHCILGRGGHHARVVHRTRNTRRN